MSTTENFQESPVPLNIKLGITPEELVNLQDMLEKDLDEILSDPEINKKAIEFCKLVTHIPPEEYIR